MEKIISLFKRDYDGNRQVIDEVVPGAEWVTDGEGRATVKIDGTCCMVRDGKLYKRYDAKKGKVPPPDFESAQELDPVTGHHPGWVPVGDDPTDKYHQEALAREDYLPNGTYELIGPKVQGNPYKRDTHILVRHGSQGIEAPRSFSELLEFFEENLIEGIVWHHPDGHMVKIKRRDFGLKWPVL